MNKRFFVYAFCGKSQYINDFYKSISYLKRFSEIPILVVTDPSRNEILIEHENIISVQTPEHFTNHQAGIYLKTGLHKFLDLETEYCYLDTDVIAIQHGVDEIFSVATGPISFIKDKTTKDSNLQSFSNCAVYCNCDKLKSRFPSMSKLERFYLWVKYGFDNNFARRFYECNHLKEKIESKFQIVISNENWVHWNGGVFVLKKGFETFMNDWHSMTMEIFKDQEWKTRDQGTLIATVWKNNLQEKKCLPIEFNFLVNSTNAGLSCNLDTGFAVAPEEPLIFPKFIHLISSSIGVENFDLAQTLNQLEHIKR